MTSPTPFLAAQAPPVLLDRDATIGKACALIVETARRARLRPLGPRRARKGRIR